MLSGAAVVFESLTGTPKLSHMAVAWKLQFFFFFFTMWAFHRASHNRVVGSPQSEVSERERTRQRPECPL